METPDRLSTIHDAVTAASLETTKKTENPKLTVGSYKVDAEVQAAASQICRHNGTKLSAYLRQCCELLVRDYQSPASTETPKA